MSFSAATLASDSDAQSSGVTMLTTFALSMTLPGRAFRATAARHWPGFRSQVTIENWEISAIEFPRNSASTYNIYTSMREPRSSCLAAAALDRPGVLAKRCGTAGHMLTGMRALLATTTEDCELPKAAIFDLGGTLLDSVGDRMAGSYARVRPRCELRTGSKPDRQGGIRTSLPRPWRSRASFLDARSAPTGLSASMPNCPPI
jgi:hypothetical protein